MIFNTGGRCGASMSPCGFLQQCRQTEDIQSLGTVFQQKWCGLSSPENGHHVLTMKCTQSPKSAIGTIPAKSGSPTVET